MARKKIDARVRTLIENGLETRHRSLFVIIGDQGKEQVANLHYILSKAQVSQRPSVLWCYKKDLGFSSHRRKRMKQEKKKKQVGTCADEKDDPFELFLTSTPIRYSYYDETEKIIGNTFGMCVLQDFEALTPNLLARTIETVQGGGIVILLLKTLASLKQLYTMTMDVHSRYRTETHHDIVARFNERFLLSLTKCDACLVVDDQLDVLPISSATRHIEPVPHGEHKKTPQELELDSLKKTLLGGDAKKTTGPLIACAKTLDQANVVRSFVQVLQEKSMRTTVSLTAARGRGKSAALGLAMAAAIGAGFSNIFLTSPSPENLKTLFEFLFKGLDALGYEEHLDYDIVQSAHADFNKAIVRVNVFRGHRQTILYIQPQDAHVLGQAELVVIDEAAAIPLPIVQALTAGQYLVFMASTINGYEGTGRSLSLKLIQQLRERSSSHGNNARILKELKLDEPIRYGVNDPIESWLNQLLCLDVSLLPSRVSSTTCPHPGECQLYAVNRDTLFSFHRASESFLQRMMALYVASHYKNTPNDLQLMSDAPAHQLYVLLPPVDEQTNVIPEVLCVLQVCLEGSISKQIILNNLARGKRGGGDLIPWTVSQQFQDEDFATLSGARIVRIAVHPEMQGMGYGTRAMQLLEQYYLGKLWAPGDDEEGLAGFEEKGTTLVDEDKIASSLLHKETIKPRTNLSPLLVKVSEKRPIHLHWLGVSFGLTSSLFKFWKKLGYSPIYLRQTTNEITGEHTAIVLKQLKEDALAVSCAENWLGLYYADFRRRFISLLSYQFQSFPAVLCLSILEKRSPQTSTHPTSEKTNMVSPHDLKRLQSYANNMLDYHMIMDLLPEIARSFFIDGLGGNVSLSPVQAAILLILGLQHRAVEDVEKELKLPVSQILAMFTKLMRKMVAHYRNQRIEKLEDSTSHAGEAVEAPQADVQPSGKRAIEEIEACDHAQDLEADLDEGARLVNRQLCEKRRELINSLGLDQFAIGGTEEEWGSALGRKQKDLKSTVVSISNQNSSQKKRKTETAKALSERPATDKERRISKTGSRKSRT